MTGLTHQHSETTNSSFRHIGTKAEMVSGIPDESDAKYSTVLSLDLSIKEIHVALTE